MLNVDQAYGTGKQYVGKKMVLTWAASSSVSQWETSPTKHCNRVAERPSVIFAQSKGGSQGGRRGGDVLFCSLALVRLLLACRTVWVKHSIRIILKSRSVSRGQG